jgi:hypothetical protein
MRTSLMTALCFTCMLAVSACSFEKQDGQMKAKFHPPFVYPEWKTHHSRTEDGHKVCVVTNGHNGLMTSLYYANDGTPVMNVEHTRRLSAGVETTLRVNGNVYRTRSSAFYPSQASAIITDLSAGDKAYLEWSEIYVGMGGRMRSTTIIPLDNFKAMFDQCVASLKP